ncbi:hypothetical protein GGF32_003459, partial [Allomyces javanicus]
MGCGASKQAAEQAIPSDQRTAPGQPVASPATATATTATAPAPAAIAPAATATPTTAAPARPAAAASSSSSAGKAKPTSAARSLVDPAIRSDSGIGTRHSAGSNKSVPAPLPAKPLPSIAAASAAAPAPANGAQPTAFEIPLDDAVKVKARKPMSANPRNRRRTQLQPVHVSNEELMRKIKEAEAKWDE